MIAGGVLSHALRALLESMSIGPKPHRPPSSPNFRGDGHDAARLASARVKRERRAARNLRNEATS